MYEWLHKLPADKVMHFLGGAAILGIFYGPFSLLIALGVVVFIAALKEILDKVTGKGTPDIYDFIVTVAGGVFAIIARYIADYLSTVKTIISFIS